MKGLRAKRVKMAKEGTLVVTVDIYCSYSRLKAGSSKHIPSSIPTSLHLPSLASIQGGEQELSLPNIP